MIAKLLALWPRIAPYKWVILVLVAFVTVLYFAFKKPKVKPAPEPDSHITTPKSGTVSTHDTTQNAIDAFKQDAKRYRYE